MTFKWFRWTFCILQTSIYSIITVARTYSCSLESFNSFLEFCAVTSDLGCLHHVSGDRSENFCLDVENKKPFFVPWICWIFFVSAGETRDELKKRWHLYGWSVFAGRKKATTDLGKLNYKWLQVWKLGNYKCETQLLHWCRNFPLLFTMLILLLHFVNPLHWKLSPQCEGRCDNKGSW